jgi:hypothetical protein
MIYADLDLDLDLDLERCMSLELNHVGKKSDVVTTTTTTSSYGLYSFMCKNQQVYKLCILKPNHNIIRVALFNPILDCDQTHDSILDARVYSMNGIYWSYIPSIWSQLAGSLIVYVYMRPADYMAWMLKYT